MRSLPTTTGMLVIEMATPTVSVHDIQSGTKK